MFSDAVDDLVKMASRTHKYINIKEYITEGGLSNIREHNN